MPGSPDRTSFTPGRVNVSPSDTRLMRLLTGAGTPKEAVARGWCFLVLLPIRDGAADGAILMVLVANSAVPALIVFRMAFDHRPDETTTSSTG